MSATKASITVAVLVLTALTLGSTAKPAQAQCYYGSGYGYCAPPVYVAPPVYCAPQPVYCQPPVYYYPRPYAYYGGGYYRPYRAYQGGRGFSSSYYH